MRRHQLGIFSALLALCAGNSPVTVEFPSHSQWRGALMFSLICTWTNGWVNNRGTSFETPSCSLWRHCNDKHLSRMNDYRYYRYKINEKSWPPCTYKSSILQPIGMYKHILYNLKTKHSAKSITCPTDFQFHSCFFHTHARILYTDGLVQDCSNSIANALQLLHPDSKVHGANMGPCRPQMDPMLAPWTLLSGCSLVLTTRCVLVISAVTCPRVPTPANGELRGKDFMYGAEVSFTCFWGFQLSGSRSRTCQQDGT